MKSLPGHGRGENATWVVVSEAPPATTFVSVTCAHPVKLYVHRYLKGWPSSPAMARQRSAVGS